MSDFLMNKVGIFNLISRLSLAAVLISSTSLSMAASFVAISQESWNQLPSDIKEYYRANNTINPFKLSDKDIVSIRSWYDSLGANYLVQLQRQNENANYSKPAAELVAHLYTLDNEKAKRTWQLYDAMPCDLDVIAEFADSTVLVTDINNNGVAEISIPYYIGCRGDVSYDQMKIIMYEAKQKFAIRGNSAICNSKTGLPVDSTGHYGGEYKIDENLLQQSTLKNSEKALFRNHLKTVWQDNQCSVYFNYDNI